MDRQMLGTARRRVVLVAVLGLVVGLVVGLLYRVTVAPLVGYDAATLTYLGYVWSRIWRADAEETSRLAVVEDPTHASADLTLLLAAVVSLGAVAWAITRSHSAHGATKAIEIGLGIASIALSWALVHTIFALKYARLYYGGSRETEGGVEFEHKVRPPYSDFAYLAFTIGMTFQVSDTDLQSAEYRRLALRHALLSYLFGAVILAAAINLVAGLAT